MICSVSQKDHFEVLPSVGTRFFVRGRAGAAEKVVEVTKVHDRRRTEQNHVGEEPLRIYHFMERHFGEDNYYVANGK